VSISVDALTDATFPGKVIAVGPVGSRQSGVVSFPITISVESITMAAARTSRATGSGTQPSGSASGATSGTAGNTTRQRPQGSTPASGSAPATAGSNNGQNGNIAPVTPQAGQQVSAFASLKEGLTATGTIIIEQKVNVLTVPSRAVRTQRGLSTVQVVAGAATVQREVQIGITDGTRMEIISGLEEKERVVIPKTAIRTTNVPTGPTTGFGGSGGFR
jgi:hypothetical protein